MGTPKIMEKDPSKKAAIFFRNFFSIGFFYIFAVILKRKKGEKPRIDKRI